MYQGCNKTALSSQKNIAEAFSSLLKEKPYSKINIKEICESAAVSRQTFYSLFSSKENIVAFILSKKYSFNPSKECNCCGKPTLRELSLGFAAFIVQKSDFIELLEKNNLNYLLQQCLYEGFICCNDEKTEHDRTLYSCLVSDFITSGLTSIARYYVKNRDSISESRLAEIINYLFSGEIFTDS